MLLVYITLFYTVFISEIESNISDLCVNFHCEEIGDEVCGIREEGNGYKLKLFPNECALIKYGCDVGTDFAFGVISMFYCTKALKLEQSNPQSIKSCDFNCSSTVSKACGIKNDGEGYRVRMFENECQLLKFNCKMQAKFKPTDIHICNGVKATHIDAETETQSTDNNNNNQNDINHDIPEITTKIDVDELTTNFDETTEFSNINGTKNIVIIDSSMVDVNYINQTIDDFIAATHTFRMPVKDITNSLSEPTRRRLEKIWGPVTVFRPWVIIPDEKLDDDDHLPTIDSCYHKCPRKCPDTYTPVCGHPGVDAREPSVMFQNHCYMDVAQCKVFRENRSYTAQIATFQESTFVYCLGNQMNGMYRFLPLIRTLQHMGRLKSKGNFHYKVKNMKFFNENILRQPKYMG